MSVLSAADKDELAAVLPGQVVFDEPMRRRTTLKIGGPADALCTPATIASLISVLRLARARRWPVTAIGGGTNLLVRDGGIRGLVIATRNLRKLVREGDTVVRVEAGVSTGKLLSSCTRWELGGVEFLGGVPGSVGGGMIMNAGTYLGEFKDVTREVASVRVEDGAVVRRDNHACGFGYRRSELPASEIVVEAVLQLQHRAASEIDADVRQLKQRRHEREPKKVSNSGSTFKNPEGDYAGRLIEAAGLKGLRVGGAQVSPKHANWLVNTGGASAADLLALMDIVRKKVVADCGIELQLELKILGEE